MTQTLKKNSPREFLMNLNPYDWENEFFLVKNVIQKILFFQQSWKWKIAPLETKVIFQGPIFHENRKTMIMGGRVVNLDFQCQNQPFQD